MYSPLVIDKRLYQAKKVDLKWKRRQREDSIEISSKLEKLWKNLDGSPLPEGQIARPLVTAEQEFVDSELLLCKVDFRYFFERYYCLELDPGVGSQSGIGPPILLESQLRYITLFGRREDECWEEKKKFGFTTGILAYLHKTRQVVATATVRAMTVHRFLFWPGTRCFASGLDDQGKGELFKRDHLALDRLPVWMKTAMKFKRWYPDVKDTELGIEFPANTRIRYEAENQQTGIGTGTQQDVSHLTEVALWHYPNRIRFSFAPAIPKAVTTLHVQESTSDGKGYWMEVTEAARHKRRGYENWLYAFIPWYYNKRKYRDNPPGNWEPEEHTRHHAELIEKTSPEFCDGAVYRPSREQLYWWESTRAQHAHDGELATFLTNYPATPEQSFQSPNQGALPVELVEQMEMELAQGRAYDVEAAA